MRHLASRGRGVIAFLVLALTASAFVADRPAATLAGEWDVYIALSARPHAGFEGWRRMGFAHFAGTDSGSVGWLRRRTGQPMLNVTSVSASGDSVLLTQDERVTMRASSASPSCMPSFCSSPRMLGGAKMRISVSSSER